MQQPDSETSSPGAASAPTSTLTPDCGPGVAWGKAFAGRLREHGVSGAGILRPLIDELNARAAMSAFDKRMMVPISRHSPMLYATTKRTAERVANGM